jgi:Family of unknown function (DUF5819)
VIDAAATTDRTGSRAASRQNAVLALAALVGALAFAWHAFAVIIFNLPPNPLLLEVQRPVNTYMAPFFQQGWNFFAPNPVETNMDAYVRYEYADPAGRHHISPWFDMTTSIDHSLKHNRLSPLVMVDTAVATSLNLFANDNFQVARRTQERFGPTAVVTTTNHPYDLIALERAAMALMAPPEGGGRFYRLQLAIRRWEFPRFTHRAQPDDPVHAPSISVTYSWTPWQYVAPVVAANRI